ncbi:DUF2341 domain-containing protein [Sphingomonas sp. KR3-1]|uniref:DUF2341 domain-containing protein n=1 Tax=Sphingomonas sp. KR3-1 TaxID=3156611 RepID=UPI0032B5262A
MKLKKIAAVIAALLMLPQVAHAWWDPHWAYRKALTVDTGAPGSIAEEAQKDFPILLRLDSSNIRFEDLKTGGADLRFLAQDDKTPLAYQIESFDAKLGIALVWVKLPELPAGGQQKIWLYYGNKEAPAASAPASVWNAGYRAVYHFSGADAARDATSNRNDLPQGPALANAGWIGNGAALDGTRSLAITAAPALAIDPAQGISIQAWVSLAKDKPANGVLYANQGGASSIVIGVANGVPYLDIVNAGRQQRVTATTALSSDWTAIAVTANAGGATLYVNGQVAGQSPLGIASLAGGGTIGGDSAGNFLAGTIDEFRIAGSALPADAIAADYAATGRRTGFLSFGTDEQQGGGGGAFGTIVRSTPIDAWAVIGVLGVMFVIAVWVMASKAALLGRFAKANAAFLRQYRGFRGDVAPIAEDEARRNRFGESPLYHLFRTGMAELAERIELYRGEPLSAETLAAMRSSLDGQQVRENQRLDSQMVLLTIAIAGGPFIGLLGTVLGVMITFGAIAAAGDVNVNAIAPGIASALLATVAGLAVAIPALFGYNYLNSRIRALSDDMQVFVDNLITRLAEAQRHAAPVRVAANQ